MSIRPDAFPMHVYEVRPRKDHRGVDLISDVLPFGRLWYGDPNAISNAIGYANHRSRSHDAVIRVYDESWHPVFVSRRVFLLIARLRIIPLNLSCGASFRLTCWFANGYGGTSRVDQPNRAG